MNRKKISALGLYCCLFLYVFGIMAILRILFWWYAAVDMPEPVSQETIKAFSIGLRFDARIAALFLLPLALVLSIPRFAVNLHRFARIVATAYAPLFFLLLLVYVIDFGFYQYLHSRVNTLIFELLADFRVAVEMVLQSYPVALIILAVLVVCGLCLAGIYHLARIPVAFSPSRKRRLAGFVCGFFIFALAVYGQFGISLFPLRWSHAYFTTHDAVIALGLNPVQSLFDTSKTTFGTYDLDAVRRAYPGIAALLRVDEPNAEKLVYKRAIAAKKEQHHAAAEKTPNVIIVVMESLDYRKTSFAPGGTDPTPNIRNLAAESLLFHRFFANARTTARAVFSIITGIPDVTEGSTGSRNSQAVDQKTVVNEFKEYDKYYLMGGSTAWANIRAVLGRNIDGLIIKEESDWKAPYVDVWGISDYDLLQEANELFATRAPKKPFLAVIQTASYHKPYTIPATAPGFIQKQLSKEDMGNYGFIDEQEYNSLRFSDFAVGEFMRVAKKEAYYENTLFFIFGDHGLNDSCRNMPTGYAAANLGPWHVPLLIHASPQLGLVSPGESMTPGSHVDIFPTAAALAGIEYKNWTLGRDLFDPRFEDSHIAYIDGKKGTPIRLVWGDYCYYDNKLGKQLLFRISGDDANLAEKEPTVFLRLKTMAESICTTAHYMLFNNRKGRE